MCTVNINMWKHYCPAEKTYLSVGSGEPCNWCGKESNLKTKGEVDNELLDGFNNLYVRHTNRQDKKK